MSRYEFGPDGWPARYTMAIGWDEPLDTYFAQVMDHSIVQEGSSVIVWLGGRPPHYRDLDAMMRQLNGQLGGTLPDIALTERMRATLAKDRKRSPLAKRRVVRRESLFALDVFPLERAE